MDAPGKYVRAPLPETRLILKPRTPGKYVRVQTPAETNDTFDHYFSEPEDRTAELEAKILELQGVIEEINTRKSTEILCSKKEVSSNEGSIRWDIIKPFPKNVPTSKMWEAWRHFIEDFEIASSLANIHSQKRRMDMLLLSMGDELKSIVGAAKLRPPVDDEECFKSLVKNIDKYLKSMTDPAAEHEAFSNMRQEEGESAVSFHARLTEKVQLCGYSEADTERFVWTQLTKGLRNADLRKDARIYGHDVNKIVVSATRAEAFASESVQASYERSAMAISRSVNKERNYQRNRPTREPNRRVQFRNQSQRYNPYVSQQRLQVSRRKRCVRCFENLHDGKPCPAEEKQCYRCKQFGHVMKACRAPEVDVIQDQNLSPRNQLVDKHEQVTD
ncbi:uncharacterized protein LOC129756040 [Uranotaenia lowii]|uniref:uncharacterized protein LOC129756040 n=1 Tax=Uranotaenia lowii TaxID=190385 RepID=UPI00247855FD|nr:uncharacterized protein LOC129756040 [Uranotaenia lowii]